MSETAAAASSSSSSQTVLPFKVAHGKNTYDISLPSVTTVLQLKQHLEPLTGVPQATMKLLYKGLLKDDNTLDASNIKEGVKVILMGSSVAAILQVTSPILARAAGGTSTGSNASIAESPATSKYSWSQETEHKKVLEKGKPEDMEVGILNSQDPLPSSRALKGMYNRAGGKTRLTFKRAGEVGNLTEGEELWIGTNERTQKVPYSQIRDVSSQPIEGHDEYHILALRLGPTEKSNYFVYWVPAQYVDAIKNTILGFGRWL